MKTYWPVRPAKRSTSAWTCSGVKATKSATASNSRSPMAARADARVADVALQHVRLGGQRAQRAAPAVEHVEVDPEVDGALRARGADLPRASDEQDLQGGHAPDRMGQR